MKLAALSLLATFISCDTIVNPTVTQTVTQGREPSSSTVAVTDPGQGFNNVALEVFDPGNCPPTPSGELRVGCVTGITATPRLDSQRVSPEVHGPTCEWFLDGERVGGLEVTSVVALAVSPSNVFNVSARGLAPGTFTLEAVVRGVRSGAREFRVR